MGRSVGKTFFVINFSDSLTLSDVQFTRTTNNTYFYIIYNIIGLFLSHFFSRI